MKIILKYIVTNVKERKVRTIVMFLSILLSTVLIFVSFSIGTSYENAQRKMARGMAGSATAAVRFKDTNRGINTNDIPALSSIQAKVGMLEGTALYHENGYYETIDLIASDLTQLNQINKPRLVKELVGMLSEELSGEPVTISEIVNENQIAADASVSFR